MISANLQNSVAICSIVPRDAHARIAECGFPANKCLSQDFVLPNRLIVVRLCIWRKGL